MNYFFGFTFRRLLVFGCIISPLASCSSAVPADYVSEIATTSCEIDTAHDALKRGVELIPIGIGTKSLHPEGEFTFRLRIDIDRFSNMQDSMAASWTIHDHNFDLVYREDIDLASIIEFERLVTIKRPHYLKIFVASTRERCDENKTEPMMLVFDVNKIYSNTVVASGVQ